MHAIIILSGVQVSFRERTITLIENGPSMDLCVELQGLLGRTIAVNIEFLEQSASFQDFTNRDTTINFNAGDIALICIQLGASMDDILENDEVFSARLSSLDNSVDIVNGSIEVTIRDSSEVVVGFDSPSESVVEGSTFSVCVRIFSGRLAEQIELPLIIVPEDGAGM